MTKNLNDTILRNIIGDGSGDHGDFLTRKIPELRMKRLPKKDMYGRNLEEPAESSGPAYIPESTPAKKKESLFQKFGKGFQKVEQGYFAATQKNLGTPQQQPSEGFIPNMKFGKKSIGGLKVVNIPEEQTTPNMYAAAPIPNNNRIAAARAIRENLDNPEIRGGRIAAFTGTPFTPSPYMPTTLYIPTEDEKYLTQQQKKDLAQRKYEAKVAEFGGATQKQRLRELEIQQKQNAVEKGRAELAKKSAEAAAVQQKIAIERGVTPIERFYKSIQRVATPLTENLGYNIGGAFAGSFNDEAAGRKYRNAILAYNAYTTFLKNKYAKKGVTIRGDYDILAVGTAGEKKRITDLRNDIQKGQQNIASTGFLSGGGGQAALIGLGRKNSLQTFTQAGAGTENLGTYGPEALGRLGVSQGLRSNDLGNKWESLIGRGGGGSDRVAQILGKSPDPTGSREKLKRYL